MISIIVPIYNVAEYLPQCIESICGQTYQDIEILLVDDGSTDGCYDICEEYRKKDNCIVVIHKENGGAVSARKMGLVYASGEYIAFVDGDDWIEPCMMERLYTTLVQEQVDIVMCGRYEDTGSTRRQVFHGIPEGRYDKVALLEKVYPHMIVNGPFFEWGLFPGVWDKLFRRECLEKYQMAVAERITMGDDAACTYPCLLNADSICILKECLYHYRQTPSSMVRADTDAGTQRKRFHILYHSVLDSLKQYTDIYDLTRQWKEYLLFLMVPRSGMLYEGMEKLDYLFPFPKVKKGSNIILYGMGTYGQHLYRFIKRTGFCNVLLCVDRNYVELGKQGIIAGSPDEIDNYDYDAIVIANSFAGIRNEIYQSLAKRHPKEKIHMMDVELVKSDETLKAFGLI